MFMIWDSRLEDLQLFWLNFQHWLCDSLHDGQRFPKKMSFFKQPDQLTIIKQREAHWCLLSTVATNALVLKHRAISIYDDRLGKSCWSSIHDLWKSRRTSEKYGRKLLHVWNSKKLIRIHFLYDEAWKVFAVSAVLTIWRLCCQKQVSQAGISNYIPQFTVGCNYLCLPEIPVSCNKVPIYPLHRASFRQSYMYYIYGEWH